MAAKDADLASDYATQSLFATDEKLAVYEIVVDPTVGLDMSTVNDDFLFVLPENDGAEIEILEVVGVVPPPVVDSTPPTVANLSPAAGTGIESTQVISFDIADETALAHVAVFASFADGTVEMIHDGDGFRGNYVGGANTRSAIAGGYSYSVLRVGGWVQAPTIEYLPIDSSGNLGVIA